MIPSVKPLGLGLPTKSGGPSFAPYAKGGVNRATKAGTLLVLLFLALPAFPQQKKPQPKTPRPAPALASLGDEVPAALLKHPQTCETGEDRHEPCATLTVERERITIAWDDATKRITYLYTTTLITDQDLRTGDLLNIAGADAVVAFPVASSPHRFVSPDWCDTAAALSGDALWCAVMVPVRPRSGRVLGFVQSIYLALPNLDAAPIQRTSASKPSTAPPARRSQ